MKMKNRSAKIAHTIRTKDGQMKTVKINPLNAIKLHCIECMGFDYKEVTLCTAIHCPLYPFRKGTPKS